MISLNDLAAHKRFNAFFFPGTTLQCSQTLERVAAGEVDAAIHLLQCSRQRVRRLTLNVSVDDRFEGRAPTPSQQVDFFTRARALTKLRAVDDLRYHVALTYQAIEAGNRSELNRGLQFLQKQLPSLERKRAYFPTLLGNIKQGHHRYYSAVNALLHAAIDTEAFDLFEALTDDAEAFFYRATMKVKDKAFPVALFNAQRIAGLSALWWQMKGDAQRTDRKLALMPAMLKFAISRKSGPLNYISLVNAVRVLHESQALRRDLTPERCREVFGFLSRVRNHEAQDRLFHHFTAAAGYPCASTVQPTAKT